MSEQAIKNLGLSIRKVRKEKNLSQQELADVTGISRRHIAKIENGIYSNEMNIMIKYLKKFKLSYRNVTLIKKILS